MTDAMLSATEADPSPLPPAMEDAIARIFNARARHGWSQKPVPEALLHKLYDIVKFGPTSMNSSPARFVFVMSPPEREKLAAHVMDANKAKVMAAPCTVIVAQDQAFYDEMPTLLPIREGMDAFFAANPALAEETAFRNSTLQGAYLLVAARLLGLDVGPMSGFDAAGIDRAFFSGTSSRVNFICTLGYANDEPFPRLPRLPFSKAAKIV